MKSILVCVALTMVAATAVAGERAATPSDAVVFIRLVGSVHAEIEELGQKRTIDRDRVEIATGSGFVVSPDGYVLTNQHVVARTKMVVTDGPRKTTITLKPSRIEVCFSAASVAARGAAVACPEASIHSADPALDLAVLFVGASNLPYLALGDSDVVTPGQTVQALGFPFGRLLDVGRSDPAASVPDMTTTAGTISALRAGDTAERRFLQVSANVNPGNSGGPLVDQDGFAVGVIHSRVEGGSAIGFAIPINQAKDFFESRGLDQLMPTRRLRLGAVHDLEAKGLSLRLPEGYTDASPLRARLEASPSPDDLALRIDRVRSPWTVKEIEQQLVGTEAFEPQSTPSKESRLISRPGTRPLLAGQTTRAGANDSDADIRMVYAILDLGQERLLARFVGSDEQVAFNESVLLGSLTSLEAQTLIVGEVPPVSQIEWTIARAPDGQPLVPFPSGWLVEPGAPSLCEGLPLASAQGTVVPVQDFTMALRVAVLSDQAGAPDDAAGRCSSRRGSLGTPSYASRAGWLGVMYSIEGVFVRVGRGRVLQLEVVSPESKEPFARAVLAAWVQQTTQP